MNILIHIIALFLIVLLLARLSLSVLVWIIGLGILFVAHLILGWFSSTATLLIFGLFVPVSLVLLIPGIRKLLISSPAFKLLKNHLPPMSDTEREAIESGTVWWEAELFRGYPDWSLLFNAPTPKLSAAEQSFLDNETNTLCTMVNDWQVNHKDKDLSPETWDYIKHKKFFGMVIPREYGGLGFSELAHAAVVSRLSSRSVTAAVTVMVPNSLGAGKLIKNYGTDEQKKYYLPRLASAEEIPCFALTAPAAGSDAAAIPDTGVVCKAMFEGQEVLGLKLNWNKRYITLAPVATLLGLAFHAFDPEHLLGDKEDLGLTCALIPTDRPGIKLGTRHNPLDTPFLNGPTYGKDVFIPLDWIIGGVEQIGKGWKMLMESLAVGRGISLPALGNATGQFSVLTASAYTRVRKQFNLPIGYFEGVAEKLAKIGGMAYAMDACSKLVISSLEAGEKSAVLSAMVKYFNTETAREVMNANMDIHAGRGISMGTNNYLADNFKSIPISITVEGANILTRTLMIFGQGAIRCHPYVQGEMQALQHDDIKKFDKLLFAHIGHVIANKSRAFLYSLTGGWLSAKPKGLSSVKSYIRTINTLSASFAVFSDFALLFLGGALKRREMLTGQFADAWIGLCVTSAVIKKYHDEGENDEDRILVDWICQTMLYQSYKALGNVTENMPFLGLGAIMKVAFLPVFSKPTLPSHSLTYKVARLLLNDSEARQRLIRWCYIPADKEEAIRILLDAYEQMPFIDDIEKRIKKAGYKKPLLEDDKQWLDRLEKDKLLTQEEREKYVVARKLIEKAISVDEFKAEDY
jgi:acyl-CoA dehydrogenase